MWVIGLDAAVVVIGLGTLAGLGLGLYRRGRALVQSVSSLADTSGSGHGTNTLR